MKTQITLDEANAAFFELWRQPVLSPRFVLPVSWRENPEILLMVKPMITSGQAVWNSWQFVDRGPCDLGKLRWNDCPYKKKVLKFMPKQLSKLLI